MKESNSKEGEDIFIGYFDCGFKIKAISIEQAWEKWESLRKLMSKNVAPLLRLIIWIYFQKKKRVNKL